MDDPTYSTDLTKHDYPGIAKAALEMAYCNGGVNRYRPEREVIAALDQRVLGGGIDLAFDLRAIDRWLGALHYDDLQTAVDGEQSEMEQLIAGAPAGTEAVLNAIWEHAV